MKRLFCLLPVIFLIIGTTSLAETNEPHRLLHDICKKNNLFAIYNFNTLSFTFHVKLPDKTVTRNWTWNIRQNTITLDGIAQESITGPFINDIYWLLFPLKAYEGKEQCRVSVTEGATAPLSGTRCSRIDIQYTDGKGFTPNDGYRLYIDGDTTLTEWEYLKDGSEPPKRVTTWTNYQTINGITFSLLREGDKGFKVWFTNIRLD